MRLVPLILLSGCFLSSERGPEFEEDACLGNGLFRVQGEGVDMELRVGGPCDEAGRPCCEVDGEPRVCYAGHGTLFVQLSDDRRLSVDYACVGRQTTGQYEAPREESRPVDVYRLSTR